MICSRLVSFVVIAFAVAASAAFPERRIEEHAVCSQNAVCSKSLYCRRYNGAVYGTCEKPF
ncbi:unnamed protein product [Umbelopsis ramanniana]